MSNKRTNQDDLEILATPVRAARQSSGLDFAGAFGELTTTGSQTNHIVWPIEGTPDITVPPAAGVQLSISSDNSSDTDGGTGINSVEVHYLDSDLVPNSEVVTLNGTTGVNTTATDIRWVQCMHMDTYGTGREAAGNISAIANSNTHSYIESGERQCATASRRVQAGKRLMISSMFAGSVSGTGNAQSTIRLVFTRVNGHDFTSDGIHFPFAAINVQDNSATLPLHQPISVTEGVIISMDVTTDQAARIDAGWFGWLEAM